MSTFSVPARPLLQCAQKHSPVSAKVYVWAANLFLASLRMNASLFVDTNILVYALDLDAGRKREAALRVIEAGWQTPGETALSVQVLQELHVNLVRRGRTFEEATQIVRDFYHWPVIENTLALLDDALGLQARFRLSLWDAMIVAAARASGASELLTEDLNHGQNYGGVRVRNPFVQT